MKTKSLVLLTSFMIVTGFLLVDYALNRADAARVVSRTEPSGNPAVLTVLSETYELDRIYKSMQGPYGSQSGIRLLDEPTDETLWITGIKTEVVDRDGQTVVSPEFFCHANLTLAASGEGPAAHNQVFGNQTHLDWRLFTLVPGRLGISFPPGFGLPVHGGEAFDFLSMSLNQNVTDRTVEVRFRTQIEFLKETETDGKLKPLFRRAVYGYEPLAGTVDPVLCRDGVHPGEGCGPFLGETASNTGFVESLGEQRTIHWMVRPGKYESRTPLEDQMDLPFDTTVHYVTAHLHPFGISITLNDLTTGETTFVIESTDFDDRLGVANMEELVLPEGVMLYTDHQYELVTLYDNPTSENVDAMSILYLYLLDREFTAGEGASTE